MVGGLPSGDVVVDQDADPASPQRCRVEPVECRAFLCVRCRDQSQRFQAVCILLTLAVPDRRTVVCRPDDVGQMVEPQGDSLHAGRPVSAIPVRLQELLTATRSIRVEGLLALGAMDRVPRLVGVDVEADMLVVRAIRLRPGGGFWRRTKRSITRNATRVAGRRPVKEVRQTSAQCVRQLALVTRAVALPQDDTIGIKGDRKRG